MRSNRNIWPQLKDCGRTWCDSRRQRRINRSSPRSSGVIVAVFFEELSDGKVRVSMRSKNERVDVCAICQKFGGGGHTLAAGARVRGTLAEVEEKVLEETREAVKHACVS